MKKQRHLENIEDKFKQLKSEIYKYNLDYRKRLLELKKKLQNLANKLIDNLKYDQVDIIVPAVFTENYFVNINFSQKRYYVSPSFSEPTLEDFVFANLVLDHLKENSESI